MTTKPTRRLDQLTEDELYRGIAYYEMKILTRSVYGYRQSAQDRQLMREWESKITVARKELERRKPKQGRLI